MWGRRGGGVCARESCDHLRGIGGRTEEQGRVAALVNKMTNKSVAAKPVCVCVGGVGVGRGWPSSECDAGKSNVVVFHKETWQRYTRPSTLGKARI